MTKTSTCLFCHLPTIYVVTGNSGLWKHQNESLLKTRNHDANTYNDFQNVKVT